MFTTVLKTVVSDGKYAFSTQTNGMDTVKSPMGLFNSQYIDNDLKLVDETIRTYYGLKPEHNCSDCGNIIMPASNRSVEQIVEGSLRVYGRKLCMSCVMKEIEKQKKEGNN